MKIKEWTTEKPIYCVQIIHGATEHIERYNDFSLFLTANNISVFSQDLPGHGRNYNGTCHHFNSIEQISDNILETTKHIKRKHPQIPLILLGHSMGSSLARYIYTKNSNFFDKIILIGSPNPPKHLLYLGNKIATPFSKSEYKHSKLLNFLIFDNLSYKSKLHNNTKNWLCSNPKIVSEYKKDPYCNNQFSSNGCRIFLNIMYFNSMNHIPSNKIPHLLLYGEFDPVCNFGKEMESLHSFLLNNEIVSTIIHYPMYHEILNELDNEQVFYDILHFIQNKQP